MKLYAYGPDLAIDTEISFDPDTGKLDWIKYWPKVALEKYRLVFLKNGWPRLIVQGPQADVALRSEGQAWIYTEIVAELKKGAKDYPEELYWKGQPRVEDYNYLWVQVSNKGTRMWLRRYRPGADTPVEEVELYQE